MTSTPRIPTGISVLDEMLFGGFLPASANLLEGAPGTGKTTIGIQFIVNGITQFDEPGLIITFEEFPQQYYHDALQMGWDLKAHEAAGKLKVVFTDPQTALTELEKVDGQFVEIMEDLGVKRVVIDSMTHFEYLAEDTGDLRDIERTFVNALKREGVVSILLRENNSLMGRMDNVSSKIPFIVDTYMLLKYVEVDSAIQKALCILKMRGSNHAKDIRCFRCTEHGIEVEEKFKGMEGIMSGNTHHTPQDAFVNAFGFSRKK